MLGHRTVAYLAAKYLTAEATTYVAQLLNHQDISEAALWADKIRYIPGFAYSRAWHYIDAQDDPDALRDYFVRAGEGWSAGKYDFFLQRHSILEYHNWWKSERRRSKLKERLATLGLNGLVFGHDPDGLGAPRTLAMDAGGWLIKLDTGLKEGASHGMMLRCEVSRIVRGTQLAMSENGKPICRALMPDGEVRELPVH